MGKFTILFEIFNCYFKILNFYIENIKLNL
jgi:hypothetical protein